MDRTAQGLRVPVYSWRMVRAKAEQPTSVLYSFTGFRRWALRGHVVCPAGWETWRRVHRDETCLRLETRPGNWKVVTAAEALDMARRGDMGLVWEPEID